MGNHGKSFLLFFIFIITIVNGSPEEADADTETLEKVLNHYSSDAKPIIDILTKRNAEQRLELAEIYKDKFDKDLVTRFNDVLDKDILDLCIALVTPVSEYYATVMHDSLKASTFGDKAAGNIIEILYSLDDSRVREIIQSYNAIYKPRTLLRTMTSVLGDFYRDVFVPIVQGERENGSDVDEQLAKTDAETIHNTNRHELCGAESPLETILTRRNYPQLRRTFDIYKEEYESDIEYILGSINRHRTKDVFLPIVRIVKEPYKILATKLHENLVAVNHRHTTATRMIVARSKIDLDKIKEEYLTIYGKSLEATISETDGGPYGDGLIKIIQSS